MTIVLRSSMAWPHRAHTQTQRHISLEEGAYLTNRQHCETGNLQYVFTISCLWVLVFPEISACEALG